MMQCRLWKGMRKSWCLGNRCDTSRDYLVERLKCLDGIVLVFWNSPSGCGAKNFRTQLDFSCVKAFVSCRGKTCSIRPDSCHAATMLWPSSTFARPWNTEMSDAVARRPCSAWNTSHWRSCDVNSEILPSSSLTCSKQWLSRVVKSRKAPPKSARNRFGSRYSSAALKSTFVGAET